MLKLMTWVVISIFLMLSFVFTGCLDNPKEVQTQTSKENSSNQYYDDKIVVKVQSPAGEKVYEGTLVRRRTHGVTIKTDNDRTLLSIAAEFYTVEKQISR